MVRTVGRWQECPVCGERAYRVDCEETVDVIVDKYRHSPRRFLDLNSDILVCTHVNPRQSHDGFALSGRRVRRLGRRCRAGPGRR